MPMELTPQRLQTAPGSQPDDPKLELHDIQGDVLIGLQKKLERFAFFNIIDVDAFKSALRSSVSGRITSTATVHAREFALNERKQRGIREVLPLVGLNLGFTISGVKKLLPDVDFSKVSAPHPSPAPQAPDSPLSSFVSGAKSRAGFLGDQTELRGSDPVPTTWLPQFVSDEIDGVFLVTGGTEEAVDDEAAIIFDLLDTSVAVVFEQTGNVRPAAQSGHEHFGWLDGVSQPGVAGLTDPFPGQQQVDPGLFVFGYGATQTPPLPWMKNGSLSVFRRLKQSVPELEKYLLEQADALGTDPVLLGSRLVGRWKSGAPMALTPSQDDLALGGNPQENNDFDFADDQQQRRCPFGAHIRKLNPRTDLAISLGQPRTAPSATLQAAVSPKRIMRQGIPYGPEVSAEEDAKSASEHDRGLLFVCYQTSVSQQFEFLQHDWANNPGFIFGKKRPNAGRPNDPTIEVGYDPIIGQNDGSQPENKPPAAAQPAPRSRVMDEPLPNYPSGDVRSTLQEPNEFITPTGGAYFFVPSLSAIKDVLAA